MAAVGQVVRGESGAAPHGEGAGVRVDSDDPVVSQGILAKTVANHGCIDRGWPGGR